eukprot:TRINITY_DN4521_c0_g1_i3.p1 TRINITY_DN4521_c0_g1~~TRINITY_DN4521_c0_g1_i3.p1  ORF type:complete len:191 (-),score=-25.15 TRINITY_DN4521_c0_g1_i3:593-1165(-)
MIFIHNYFNCYQLTKLCITNIYCEYNEVFPTLGNIFSVHILLPKIQACQSLQVMNTLQNYSQQYIRVIKNYSIKKISKFNILKLINSKIIPNNFIKQSLVLIISTAINLCNTKNFSKQQYCQFANIIIGYRLQCQIQHQNSQKLIKFQMHHVLLLQTQELKVLPTSLQIHHYEPHKSIRQIQNMNVQIVK